MNADRPSSGKQLTLTPKTAVILGVSAIGVLVLLGATIWITAHVSGGGSGTGAGGGGGSKSSGAASAAKNANPPAPLDDAAREARQRALAQIPESSGTVAPVEALRRVPISLPPPAAAGGKVTAPPTPVKLDVPSGTPVTPARPGTPATPGGQPGGGVRPPPPPTPGGAALPANDANAPLPLELALHPSLYTDVNKVAARLAPVTLGGTSATVSATPITADPQEKLRLEAIRLEKARQFVMSMCLDQQGRIWVGCENTQPGDGTGGIQVFTPGAPRFQEWKQYTVKDGLGDDNGYAVACDLQGRIWAGHLNHGVSVFNGEKWQTYEVVGGLSRPDTLNGPLGERIFHITVCPATATGKFKDALTDKESAVAGSVWMCTSAGLSIYFPSTDTWSYLTRADGLPSDQANSLAFDKDGMVFVANQCDGISIASPADGYKSWKQVARRLNGSQDGPLSDELPTTPTGTGLPTNLMNDILVAKDGTVYAATTAGLAWSLDKGNTWQFVRGADYADKVKGRIGGAPAGWEAGEEAVLSEDYSTCLAKDEGGNICVGHRATNEEILRANATQKLASFVADYVTCVLPLTSSGVAISGTYAGGVLLRNIGPDAYTLPATTHAANSPRTLPKAATPLADTSLAKPPRVVLPNNDASVSEIVYLGTDWATQGDWVGRYGRILGMLCAAGSPDDHEVSYGLSSSKVEPQLGTRAIPDAQVRNWCWAVQSTEQRVLWDPTVALRRPAIWDDNGESHRATEAGPDMDISVSVSEGLHRISFYFVNYDGHSGSNRRRDYVINAWRKSEKSKCVRMRIADFYGGVYAQFAVSKGGVYVFHIDRNFSLNAILSGVFVDQWAGTPDVPGAKALPWMGNIPYEPPAVDWKSSPLAFLSERLTTFEPVSSITSRHTWLIQVLRHAQEAKMDRAIIENLKWNSLQWDAFGRNRFDRTVLEAWTAMQAINPELRLKKWRPHSPFTEN